MQLVRLIPDLRGPIHLTDSTSIFFGLAVSDFGTMNSGAQPNSDLPFRLQPVKGITH